MMEAELISAFHDYVAMMDTVLFGYINVLFAFLVMSYLVARKLRVSLVAIVLALFTAVCGVLITRLALLRGDFQALYLYILEQKGSGNLDLPWFGTNPDSAIQILTYLFYAVTVGGYLGCIGFFFYQRNARNAEIT